MAQKSARILRIQSSFARVLFKQGEINKLPFNVLVQFNLIIVQIGCARSGDDAVARCIHDHESLLLVTVQKMCDSSPLFGTVVCVRFGFIVCSGASKFFSVVNGGVGDGILSFWFSANK